MANPFRDMSVIMQGLVALAIAVILVLAGLYVPFSPVAQERADYDKAVQARTKLNQEVDEFIRQIQGAASASNVTLRRLTAQNIVPKEYHYEMPFEAQADGPYFNVLDFFSRLSRLSRIINVGDLDFSDPSAGQIKGTKY